MEGFDSRFDASGLTLLSEVAFFDSKTQSSAPSSSSSEYAAIEILTMLKIAQKKGLLLSDLEKALLIPKRKRSPSSLVRVSKRTTLSRVSKRTDLLDLYIPKKRRTARFLKRNSQDLLDPPRVKRQKITHDMGMPCLITIKSDFAAIKSDFGVIKSILDLQLQLVVDGCVSNEAWHRMKGRCSLDSELKLVWISGMEGEVHILVTTTGD